MKPRFGAVGKHGSISVTERVIKTLKYEWFKRIPIIKGFDHLTMLCEKYENWYVKASGRYGEKFDGRIMPKWHIHRAPRIVP